MIDGYPAEPELVPLRHAAWVDTEPGIAEWKKGNMNMACSNCKHRAGKYKHKTYRYCPWCGAKMDLIERIEAYECPDDNTVSILTFIGSKHK